MRSCLHSFFLRSETTVRPFSDSPFPFPATRASPRARATPQATPLHAAAKPRARPIAVVPPSSRDDDDDDDDDVDDKVLPKSALAEPVVRKRSVTQYEPGLSSKAGVASATKRLRVDEPHITASAAKPMARQAQQRRLQHQQLQQFQQQQQLQQLQQMQQLQMSARPTTKTGTHLDAVSALMRDEVLLQARKAKADKPWLVRLRDALDEEMEKLAAQVDESAQLQRRMRQMQDDLELARDAIVKISAEQAKVDAQMRAAAADLERQRAAAERTTQLSGWLRAMQQLHARAVASNVPHAHRVTPNAAFDAMLGARANRLAVARLRIARAVGRDADAALAAVRSANNADQ